jgi:hypothetical protein
LNIKKENVVAESSGNWNVQEQMEKDVTLMA